MTKSTGSVALLENVTFDFLPVKIVAHDESATKAISSNRVFFMIDVF